MSNVIKWWEKVGLWLSLTSNFLYPSSNIKCYCCNDFFFFLKNLFPGDSDESTRANEWNHWWALQNLFPLCFCISAWTQSHILAISRCHCLLCDFLTLLETWEDKLLWTQPLLLSGELKLLLPWHWAARGGHSNSTSIYPNDLNGLVSPAHNWDGRP